ncbi:MAG: gliding motility-associated C-terminal domain-containing protein [Flavobacteriales bacterium]|nr:gliding motility-associated C-terminal domain-containing protein [Flavobacteriales bacterium]MEB2342790.1 gliding motility-associated C-terminal domain-containing protein [Flavobacteriia bacterium]
MVDQIPARNNMDQPGRHPMRQVLSVLMKMALVLAPVLIWHSEARATHAMGGELTYTCLGNNRWEVTLNFYRDCNGIAAPTNCNNGLEFRVRSTTCGANFTQCFNNNPTVTIITPICPSETDRCISASGTYGVQRYTYKKIVDLSSYASCGANDWYFSWSLCCRNNSITSLTSPGNRELYLDARLNKAAGLCNNSPTFTNSPAAFYCLGEQISYNPGAVDADGDSLAYSLIAARGANGANLPYAANYSAQQPIRNTGGPNAVVLDPQTGTMTVTPSVIQVAVVTYQVREYRNGVLVGTITRDVQFVIRACTGNQPPTVSGINGTSSYTMQVCAGSPVTFTVNSNDPNAGQVVTMSWNSGIPGATFTSAGSPHPVGTFTWTPTVANLGNNTFTVHVEDNGCPLKATNDYGFTIQVTPPATDVDAGTDFAVCGPNATMAAPPLPYPGLQGTWSVVSGSGTFANPNSRTSAVSGLSLGPNVFRWTVDYQTCGTRTDEVTVTSYSNAQAIAAAGFDQDLCGPPNAATLDGNAATAPATGTWSFVTGSGTITNPNSPTTTVTGLAFGTNRLRWTINNGPCGTTQDEVEIRVFNSAQATAFAGTDFSICTPASSVTLDGNAATAPAVGTWTVVSGAGTITNPNQRNTTVTGLAVGVHVFRWTITNGPCTPGSTSDEVTVTVYNSSSPDAQAGDDQEVCGTAIATLAGNTPIFPATGTWTLVSGAGTITSPNSPGTTVTGLGIGANVFQWTVHNGPCANGVSTDQVTIMAYDQTVAGANAGPDRSFCLPTTSVTMQANAPAAPAQGTWTLVSGTGTIADPNSATTTITGLSVGENVFQWAITNGPCMVTPPSDLVSIFIYDNNAPAAFAGPDQDLCTPTTATLLAGNTPVFPATGQWTVVNGSGIFADASNPTTGVSGLGVGVNTFRWTITNGPCANPITQDDVVITVYSSANAIAQAGNDQDLCTPSNSTTLEGSAVIAPATGTWTLVSGTGTIVSPNNPNTQVTGLAVGDNIFRWTVLNGTCNNPVTSDDVRIRVYDSSNPIANAGFPQELCSSSNSTTLVGSNVIYPAAGVWTLQSGGGTIVTPNNPTTAVNNLPVGVNIFRWTVTNGSCGTGTTWDEVAITIYDDAHPPVTVGPDQSICVPTSANSVTVTGTTPVAPATGQWTVIGGSGTITSPNSPSTTITDMGVGVNVFQWTVTNGPCNFPSNSAQVSISVYDGAMSTADAGPDQDLCTPITSTTLEGSALIAPGTGQWTLVSGTGVFADPADPATTVSGLSLGANVFRWTVDNGPCAASSSAEVTISVFNGNAQQAYAGPDQELCSDVPSTVLAANAAVAPATGSWSVLQGTANIANPASPTSAVSSLGIGVNILVWSIDNGACGTSTDQVRITVYDQANPVVNAGTPQQLCTPVTATTLTGSGLIAPATGTWTLVSGQGNIVSPNSPTTQVNGLGLGNNIFRWTVNNGPCTNGNAFDEVTISVFSGSAQPANAGPDQDLCTPASTATLAANISVAPAQGTWSAGAGITFSDIHAPNAMVSGLQVGDNILTWTIDNGSCGSTSAQVNIRVFDASNPPAAAGDDQGLCSPTDFTTMTGSNVIYPATGTWILVSGTGTIVDPSSPTTAITGLGVGPNTFRWTVDNGPCGAVSSEEVTITLYDSSVSGANAGPDQDLCTPQTTATMAASAAPSPAQGTWQLVSGGGTITDIHSPVTTITDLPVGENIFRWSVSNGACPVNPASDEVSIFVYDANNLVAAAGPVQHLCSDDASTTLEGSPVIFPATGHWTLISGAGTLADANDPNSAVTALGIGENIFEWTVLNGPCADPETKDRVSIFVYDENNEPAHAGPEQSLCTPNNSTALAGNTPTFPATGTWTLVQGQGVITDPANPTTTVTGLGVGENIFQWTVDNGPCASGTTTSQVSIFLFDSNAPNAHAGPDQQLCLPATSTVLEGSPAVFPATGTWTVVSGSGVFADEHDPNTGVDGLSVGANTFRWTVSNGLCSTSSSEVTIYLFRDDNPDAYAGDDQQICSPASTITMHASAVTFPAVGTWTLVSGSGVITDPNDPNTAVIDLPVGTHVFQWTVDNGPCANGITSSTMTVQVFDQDNAQAEAGDDVDLCTSGGTSYTLSGSPVTAPAVGTWTVQQGAGTFSDDHDPQATVSGLAVGVNILRWTVDNGPCAAPTWSEITITLFDEANEPANAGTTQSICTPASSVFMTGSALIFPATGQWTLVSGTGTIVDPSDPGTEITGLEVGENIFEWTVDNGPCGQPTSSQVSIFVYDANTPDALAGPAQQVCTPVTSATMAASPVIFPATGTWVAIGTTATITDPADPNTTVTNLEVGVNTFEWRVENGPCGNSTSQVTITLFDLNAPPADAGPGASFCGPPTPVQLGANTPTFPAVGTWSVSQGTGSFADIHDPSTTVSDMSIGENIYTWSFDNGVCGFTQSDVSFLVYDPMNLPAFAGDDAEFCTPQDSTWLQGNTPTFPATGTWTVVNGAGLFEDPHDPGTKVVGMAIGANTFRWTTFNGPCENAISFDEVTITIYSDSTAAANAGDDFELCLPFTSAQLQADVPQPPASGTWTILSGAGTVVDPANPHSDIVDLGLGVTVLVWNLDNGPCPNNGIMSDTLRISVYDPFGPPAEAGDFQFLCTPDDSVSMDATEPMFPAEGTWALVSGVGTIADVHDPHTAITDLGIGINVFSWTVYNGDCGFGPPTVDTTAVFIYDASAPAAHAGDAQDICGADQTVGLNGNAATFPGTGLWTVAAGSAVFDDASDPNTTVSGLSVGDNLLVWTLDNGTCGISMDTVLVRVFDSQLAGPDAGAAQDLCSPSTSTTLSASPATYPATGQWSVISGSGDFADASDPNTIVTGYGPGVNIYAWTLDNGPCGTLSDQVTITLYDGSITSANAGPDQSHCGPLGTVTLAADDVTEPATGTWTILSGAGSLTDPTDAHTTLTGLVPGQTILTWTVFNGPCGTGTMTDTMTVTIYDGTLDPAHAGPDQQFCEPGAVTVDMFATPATFPATGHWSIVGDGTITDPADPATTVTGVGFGSTVLIWTVNNGECGSSSSEMTVSVFDINARQADAGVDQALCHDTTYTHMAAVPANSTATGHWELIGGHGEFTYPEDPDAEVTGLQLGTNSFLWVVDNGACGSSSDTMLIVLRDCSILVIPDAFSPNGDGVNDVYTIGGLDYYPDNKFQVFNRWGSKVFERSPYRNTWDGTSEGKPNWGTKLPESTYYFIFDPGDGKEITTGYIYLRR